MPPPSVRAPARTRRWAWFGSSARTWTVKAPPGERSDGRARRRIAPVQRRRASALRRHRLLGDWCSLSIPLGASSWTSP